MVSLNKWCVYEHHREVQARKNLLIDIIFVMKIYFWQPFRAAPYWLLLVLHKNALFHYLKKKLKMLSLITWVIKEREIEREWEREWERVRESESEREREWEWVRERERERGWMVEWSENLQFDLIEGLSLLILNKSKECLLALNMCFDCKHYYTIQHKR